MVSRIKEIYCFKVSQMEINGKQVGKIIFRNNYNLRNIFISELKKNLNEISTLKFE